MDHNDFITWVAQTAIIPPPAGYSARIVPNQYVTSEWNQLHSYNPKTWDESKAKSILDAVIANLKTCGGCQKHAIEYIAKNVPDFSTRERYHQYLWRFHNAVSKRIGKPEIEWSKYESTWLTWKPIDGHRIGVVAVNYEEMGGTETFHHALIPRLPGVIGFASQNELLGNVDLLGVPCGHGLESIASLALQSDTVIAWNIDWHSLPRPKRLITVHHGSLSDTWGTRLCLQGDSIVCVNPEVAQHVRTLTDKPVRCIEPAVDPARVVPRNKVDTNGKKICLWSHRFHSDKRPQLAIEIAKHLPGDWHMVLTGHRGEQIELNDRVTVLPPQHPGDWLSVASCFLSTTLFEGAGLSVAEAITAGIPVVSTPTGFASRPGMALTVPIDAHPREWAKAISSVSSVSSDGLPSRDSFHLAGFLEAWEKVIATS